MSCQSHAPRVGQTLSIKYQQIWHRLQLCQCCQHRRSLSKSQQTGDIGKADRLIVHGRFNQFQSRKTENDNRSPGLVSFDTHVYAGHPPQLPDRGGHLHPALQLSL